MHSALLDERASEMCLYWARESRRWLRLSFFCIGAHGGVWEGVCVRLRRLPVRVTHAASQGGQWRCKHRNCEKRKKGKGKCHFRELAGQEEMAVHVDDLLRELEASMEEFGVSGERCSADRADEGAPIKPEQPNSRIAPTGSPTVAQVLAGGGSGAITGHLSHAQDGAWVRIFAVLASDALSFFATSDAAEARIDLIPIGPTSILYDAIPDGPLCFEVADSADNRSWMLMASSKTAKDAWVSKLRGLTRRDSGHSDASSVEDNWAHQQQKIAQLTANPPIGLRTESRPHYRAPAQLPRLNSDSSNASSNLNAMQQQYQQYSQSLSTWKAAADMHNLRRGSDGPGSHSLFSLTSDARSIAASESSSHHSLGSAGVRGGGVFGHNDGRTSPIPSVHSSNSGSEKYGVLNMFSGGASSASSGRSKSLTGKRQENKQENKLFSNLEDSGLF